MGDLSETVGCLLIDIFGKTWKHKGKIIVREMLGLRLRTYQMVSPPVGKPGISDPITGERDAMGVMNDRQQLEKWDDQTAKKKSTEN